MLAAIVISSPLLAQTDTSILALDEVIMTANKYPNKTSLTGKVVTIITREQLEKSGGKTLAQVLTEQSSLYINGANSNAGKDKTIFLRGARAEHTLITIDGVPVYDASGIGNHYDIRNMSIDNIERIEILKGSQSTLYGSDAIAGVINIITRKSISDTQDINGIFNYGSFNTLRAGVTFRGKTGVLDHNASYTYNRTDGISEAISNDPQTDKDGYEQNSLQAGLGIQVNKKIYIHPYVRFSKINGELDQGAFTDELDYTYTQKSYQAGIRNEIQVGQAKLNILYNYNSINRLYIDDSTKSRNGFDIYSRGAYKGQEHFIETYTVIPVSKMSKLTAGADFRRSHSDQ